MAENTTEAPKKKFTRKKAITLPTFKFVVDVPLVILITGPIHEGQQRVGRDGKVRLDSSGQPRKPPFLIECINLETGEFGQIIAATIIKTELDENYKEYGYVGRGFEITKQKRKEGREYDPYQIFEIDVPDEFAPAVKKAKDDLVEGRKALDAKKTEDSKARK